jgi:hypothetical protein
VVVVVMMIRVRTPQNHGYQTPNGSTFFPPNDVFAGTRTLAFIL